MTTQFHHYIPRFILRRFSENNKTIKTYDVNNKSIDMRRIGKIYGVTNMYEDISNEFHPMIVETTLSKIESSSAVIIKKFLRSRSYHN